MKNDNLLQKVTTIHFIGIGGISLSALAKLMQQKGKIVTGSDAKKSAITSELKALGLRVFIGHKKKNLKNAQLVVYTSAIKNSNIELKWAKQRGIPTLSRAEFLALVAKEYQTTIAISGSHGKTTTCGMLASIFICAGKSPTVHIGGESTTTNGNMYIGKNEYFITEACEYKDSFLHLAQTIGVILNIEYDHSDYFKSVQQIERSFQQFQKNSTQVSVVQEKYKSLLSNFENTITFGLKNANYTAQNIGLNEQFHIVFDCYENNAFLQQFELNTPPYHNTLNALASIAVSRQCGIAPKHIQEGLLNFTGIKRRFEVIREYKSNVIVHDYAHHPTEIKCTILACKKVYKKPVVVVFQPHTYSRTKALMKQFLTSFQGSNQVIIVKTYQAREKKQKGGTAKDLFKKLKFSQKNTIYCTRFQQVKRYLKKHNIKNSIILVLGAGSIDKLANNYLK
jgi:UDP-N-acetylmuramate--alanine ligase